MPENWAQQIHDAFIDVQKYRLSVDAIVIPWAWQTDWATLTAQQTDRHIFGVEVKFAIIDRPFAIIQR